MALDINRSKVTKNAFRFTKVRGITALRLRVPGGEIMSEHLDLINKIAVKYGNGTLHITTRQGFEVPGIKFEDIPRINHEIATLIKEVEIDNGVKIKKAAKGYPAAGTRNITACIGNKVCPFANFDTTALALKIEKEIYPNDYHVKIAVSGCPNDCIKAHMQDFGITGMVEPVYLKDSCIACDACVKKCTKLSARALENKKNRIIRNSTSCIGCGECVLACPMHAWRRKPVKLFRIVIMGRTGKKNPRIAQPFIEWASEEVVIKIIKNSYVYIDKYIDKTLTKEHVGYIVDRTGYHEFKRMVLDGVELNPEAVVADNINFVGTSYIPRLKS